MVSPTQERAILGYLATTRSPAARAGLQRRLWSEFADAIVHIRGEGSRTL